MLDKVDLVMWAKNGARTLPLVLRQLDTVIPAESVGNRLLVDDSSTDATREIARSFKWQVIMNEGTGVSDGANTALDNVQADFFVSVEQDLFLAKSWWDIVPAYLADSKTAVSSGIRFVRSPTGLRKLEQQMAKKCLGQEKFLISQRNVQQDVFTYGKTLDNTIYKTRILRQLGGFPRTIGGAGVDTILIYRLQRAGYNWAVNFKVQSLHLRAGLRQELRHSYWYGTLVREVWGILKREFNVQVPTESSLFYRLLASPASGLLTAIKTREPTIIYISPLLRLYYMMGLIASRKA